MEFSMTRISLWRIKMGGLEFVHGLISAWQVKVLLILVWRGWLLWAVVSGNLQKHVRLPYLWGKKRFFFCCFMSEYERVGLLIHVWMWFKMLKVSPMHLDFCWLNNGYSNVQVTVYAYVSLPKLACVFSFASHAWISVWLFATELRPLPFHYNGGCWSMPNSSGQSWITWFL